MWNPLTLDFFASFLLAQSDRCWLRQLNGRDKSVAQARKGFHKARALRKIAKNASQLIDRSIQAVFEADISVGPQLLAKPLPRYNFTRIFQQ